MMMQMSMTIAMTLIGGALLLNMYRLLRGPRTLDRVVALDTMYINAIAMIVLLGIRLNADLYFEAALIIAMTGFVGTVALSKYFLRGDIIE